MPDKNSYDVVIIGSGMGGLVCANLLALEGLKVRVLEKNKQIGGNLQTFVRDKLIFDSGVHYLGGLDKEQNLYQLFSYLNIMSSHRLERMGMRAFDKILISDDQHEYPQAQGYDLFVEELSNLFPEEAAGLKRYCAYVREVCARFPLYNLRLDRDTKDQVLEESAEEKISGFVKDEKLRAVLAGNNLLYAGEGNKTPFYVHALIINSYIESSWKCIQGGSQISKLLAKNIRSLGGEIFRHTEVVKIVEQGGVITQVKTGEGTIYTAKHFISNISPVRTLEITDSALLKQIYQERVEKISNTISSFSVHLILKQNTVVCEDHNYYYHEEGKLWQQHLYTAEDWPLGYALFYTRSLNNPAYAESITIFTMMRYEEVSAWADTFNTVSEESFRGAGYEAFKLAKAEVLLNKVSEKFPALKASVATYYTTSPLSYRDYIGSGDGTMYGFAKDYRDPLRTNLSPRTKIPNLFFTGQNMNLHGILGAALSGVLTSVMVSGNEKIVEKISNAV